MIDIVLGFLFVAMIVTPSIAAFCLKRHAKMKLNAMDAQSTPMAPAKELAPVIEMRRRA